MKTVDRLVTMSGEGAGISRGGVEPVVVGGVGVAMGVPVGGVVVQRIGFRLSQAERGYGENYDLNREMLDIESLSLLFKWLTMHFIFA